MKLLLDENLSARLVEALADVYPGSEQVVALGLGGAGDGVVWEHAKVHGFTIVSKDSDFYERSIAVGGPPASYLAAAGELQDGCHRYVAAQQCAGTPQVRRWRGEWFGAWTAVECREAVVCVMVAARTRSHRDGKPFWWLRQRPHDGLRQAAASVHGRFGGTEVLPFRFGLGLGCFGWRFGRLRFPTHAAKCAS